MQFTYQARDTDGHIRSGELTADDAAEATRQLRQEGLYLMSLEESESADEAAEPVLFQKRITRSDIIYLTNQLAVMIDAGVPLATALEGLARQSESLRLRKTLETIQKHVVAGDAFSEALARFPKLFDRTYVNLVKASEASGTLAPMLDRIATQMQNELETRQKVRGALTYPAVMLLMCVGVSVFLLAYVFPKLMPMFATRNAEVPGPTKLMIFLSTLLTDHWYWVLAAAALLAGLLLYARRQPWGRKALDWMWLNVPILGPMLRKVIISRSLRTLATTVNAGVPVLDSIELSAGVSGNIFYEQSWHQVANEVTGGKQIHEALEGNTLFPQTLVQMISSGEATGKLGMVLDKVSDYYDRELQNAIKAATSLIEPVMVFVMGGVIGTIALAMLLPIFKLSSSVG